MRAREPFSRARKENERRRRIVYARKTDIRFPPSLRADVAGAARGLAPIVKAGRGYRGLEVLTDPEAGAGMIVSFWETEADARATEGSPSYIARMSAMSSFLYEALVPKTYEVEVRE
jgi:heme-degrading monooxygenase HmoA